MASGSIDFELDGIRLTRVAPGSGLFSYSEQSPNPRPVTVRDYLDLEQRSPADRFALRLLSDVGLGGVADIDTSKASTLANYSGGEMRRIALVLAILSPAPVMVLDEPTSGLDAETAKKVIDIISATSKRKLGRRINSRPSSSPRC